MLTWVPGDDAFMKYQKVTEVNLSWLLRCWGAIVLCLEATDCPVPVCKDTQVPILKALQGLFGLSISLLLCVVVGRGFGTRVWYSWNASTIHQTVKTHCMRNPVAVVKQGDHDAAEVLVPHGEGQEMLSQAGSPCSCLSVTGVWLQCTSLSREKFSKLHEGTQSRFYLDSVCTGQEEWLHLHYFYYLVNKQSQAC